ncbi:MAG: prepilin-type N-terminal cleavage/methylation domain-containing protein [Planctomycetaceae bacterium]|nr:prepilin-type N-terminal cleavage/methylation domain-containing protein [Planctomycetaceae bacterium]
MLSKFKTTRATSDRSGFTLIELMVSIVLVSIMMLAFSQVFRIATETIVDTRGIANNDEKARTLTTIIKSDLETRTFRNVIPFDAGETAPISTDSDFELRDFEERLGYIYISDNDISNDVDDVLQLTIDRFISGQVTDTDLDNLIYGNAITFENTDPTVDIKQPSWSDYQQDNKNVEGLTASRYAEVSYFVRNGNLYRRVLLLYTPVEGANNQPQITSPPGDVISGDYDATLDGLTSYATGDFWNDFDISAFHDGSQVYLNGVGVGAGKQDSLDNNTTGIANPLAHPRTRFGFSYSSGLPREFIQEAGTPIYIGRFTHAETSHFNFDYPGADAGGSSSPLDLTTLDDSDTNGIVDTYEVTDPGPRQSEDLLMSNVLSFDVKLWDEALNAFVDIGHSLSGGDFEYSSTSVRDNYSPLAASYQGSIFDTWHPTIDLYDGSAGNDSPPYRPDDGTDPLPIRAIQITIRYHDIQSDRTRQLTIQHSLID